VAAADARAAAEAERATAAEQRATAAEQRATAAELEAGERECAARAEAAAEAAARAAVVAATPPAAAPAVALHPDTPALSRCLHHAPAAAPSAVIQADPLFSPRREVAPTIEERRRQFEGSGSKPEAAATEAPAEVASLAAEAERLATRLVQLTVWAERRESQLVAALEAQLAKTAAAQRHATAAAEGAEALRADRDEKGKQSAYWAGAAAEMAQQQRAAALLRAAAGGGRVRARRAWECWRRGASQVLAARAERLGLATVREKTPLAPTTKGDAPARQVEEPAAPPPSRSNKKKTLSRVAPPATGIDDEAAKATAAAEAAAEAAPKLAAAAAAATARADAMRALLDAV